MTRHPYHLLNARSLNTGKRRFLNEILLPLLLGISVGYGLGFIFGFEESDSVEHLAEIQHDAPETSLFFLRCLILIHPEAKKPHNFATAIRDTYGTICNQTIYYTNSEELRKKAADLYVIVADSSTNGFYWDYFKRALIDTSEVPAQWTYVGDEQGYLVVQNLRKLVRSVNHRQSIIFGRIFAQQSLLYYIFPFLQSKRMSLQSGLVFSNMAIKNLSQCKGRLLPRATESRLFACAEELGIRIVDPVDEDGMHLFQEKDLKTLIPVAYGDKHKHGNVETPGCCSDHAISYGQMSYKDIRLADFASLHFNVFGRGGIEEVNASYALDPSVYFPEQIGRKKNTTATKAQPKNQKGPAKQPGKPSKVGKAAPEQKAKNERPKRQSSKH